MLLTKKTGTHEALCGRRSSTACNAACRTPCDHGPPRLPSAFGTGRRRRHRASSLTLVKKARAADGQAAVGQGKIEVKRTVCSHCSVGCAIDAWSRTACGAPGTGVRLADQYGRALAKGAAIREHGHGEYRLRYPMKLVSGKYERISWDTALNEISAKMLDLRKASGPDSVYWVGSSKHSNEQAYLLRKFVSFWAATTAITRHASAIPPRGRRGQHVGYGAMTNSYNDMQNSKCACTSAPTPRKPSCEHAAHAARQETGTKMIVVDPRFTRTAAKADEYVRIRSGSDIPFLFGMLYHIFKNGWKTRSTSTTASTAWTRSRRRHGQVDARQGRGGLRRARSADGQGRRDDGQEPAVDAGVVHGPDQHTIGNAMVRPPASCSSRSATSVCRGGANIFRGHDNVQGATDVGPNPDSLPGYYGIVEGSWRHFAKAWNVDYDWIKGRFANVGMMSSPASRCRAGSTACWKRTS